MTVIPAYGRDYKTSKAALADWEAGKDFQIASVGPHMGAYISRRDGQQVWIRYNRNSNKVQTPKNV